MKRSYKKEKLKVLLVDTGDIPLQVGFDALQRNGVTVEIVKGLKSSYQKVNEGGYHIIVYWYFHHGHLFGQTGGLEHVQRLALIPKDEVSKALDIFQKGATDVFVVGAGIEPFGSRRRVEQLAERLFLIQENNELLRRLVKSLSEKLPESEEKTLGAMLGDIPDKIDLFSTPGSTSANPQSELSPEKILEAIDAASQQVDVKKA